MAFCGDCVELRTELLTFKESVINYFDKILIRFDDQDSFIYELCSKLNQNLTVHSQSELRAEHLDLPIGYCSGEYGDQVRRRSGPSDSNKEPEQENVDQVNSHVNSTVGGKSSEVGLFNEPANGDNNDLSNMTSRHGCDDMGDPPEQYPLGYLPVKQETSLHREYFDDSSVLNTVCQSGVTSSSLTRNSTEPSVVIHAIEMMDVKVGGTALVSSDVRRDIGSARSYNEGSRVTCDNYEDLANNCDNEPSTSSETQVYHNVTEVAYEPFNHLPHAEIGHATCHLAAVDGCYGPSTATTNIPDVNTTTSAVFPVAQITVLENPDKESTDCNVAVSVKTSANQIGTTTIKRKYLHSDPQLKSARQKRQKTSKNANQPSKLPQGINNVISGSKPTGIEQESEAARFEDVNDDDVNQLVDSAECNNTIKSTRWAQNAFKSFLQQRRDLNNELIPPAEKMPRDCIIKYMILFITGAKTLKGKNYNLSSITGLVAGIQRFFRKNGHPDINFLEHGPYNKVRKVVNAKVKALAKLGCGTVINHAEPLRAHHIQMLWDKGIFGDSDAHTLLRTVFFYINHWFVTRTGVANLDLDIAQFKFHSDHTENMISFWPRADKNDQSTMEPQNEIREVITQHSPKNANPCAVTMVKKYFDIIGIDSGRVYYQPKYPLAPGKLEYNLKLPVGINKIGSIVKDMCKEAGFIGWFTTRSIRQSDETTITKSSGQSKKSKTVRNYVHTPDGQQRDMCLPLNPRGPDQKLASSHNNACCSTSFPEVTVRTE